MTSKTFKTLIIDDDPVFQMIATKLVQRAELDEQPLTFANGKECLDYLQSVQPKPDNCLLLLDINMPVMDGWQFLDALKKDESMNDYRVIMVTSSTNESDQEKAEQYEQVKGFIIKPLGVISLQQMREKYKKD